MQKRLISITARNRVEHEYAIIENRVDEERLEISFLRIKGAGSLLGILHVTLGQSLLSNLIGQVFAVSVNELGQMFKK